MSASERNSGDSHAHGPPPPPEPKTPTWLTALGVVLFLTVGLVWGLSTPSKDATVESAPSQPAGEAAADAAPAPGH
jgi:hypothetical protein